MEAHVRKVHPGSQPRGKRAGRGLAWKSAAAAAAVATVATVGGAQPAAANTPSDYSHTFYVGATPGFQGLPVTVGWTDDHAWVIASYGAAISAGSGLIASQVCSIVSGETGPLNPLGKACSTVTTQVVATLMEGHPAMTDHGLWMAYYPMNVAPKSTAGTW